jgi:hypothetical protein
MKTKKTRILSGRREMSAGIFHVDYTITANPQRAERGFLQLFPSHGLNGIAPDFRDLHGVVIVKPSSPSRLRNPQ